MRQLLRQHSRYIGPIYQLLIARYFILSTLVLILQPIVYSIGIPSANPSRMLEILGKLMGSDGVSTVIRFLCGSDISVHRSSISKSQHTCTVDRTSYCPYAFGSFWLRLDLFSFDRLLFTQNSLVLNSWSSNWLKPLLELSVKLEFSTCRPFSRLSAPWLVLGVSDVCVFPHYGAIF